MRLRDVLRDQLGTVWGEMRKGPVWTSFAALFLVGVGASFVVATVFSVYKSVMAYEVWEIAKQVAVWITVMLLLGLVTILLLTLLAGVWRWARGEAEMKAQRELEKAIEESNLSPEEKYAAGDMRYRHY